MRTETLKTDVGMLIFMLDNKVQHRCGSVSISDVGKLVFQMWKS